jgi:acyl phosphate:glycerol-3-phosphate acyltransferase
MTYIAICIIIGYIIGCFQPSYFLAKLKKANIKEVGSKNAGASNVTIVFGWKFGIIVALIDICKPILSILIIWILYSQQVSVEFILILYYLSGTSVVIGHVFPFYMKFNGGKGTASMIGLFLAINWKFALIGLIVFVLLTIITNYIVIGAMALNAFFVWFTWFHDSGLYPLLVAGFITIILIIKHIENFIRIIKGEETGLRSVIPKHSTRI